jgi:phosphoglycolate phosphatase-like HAD superfamily hydrolase
MFTASTADTVRRHQLLQTHLGPDRREHVVGAVLRAIIAAYADLHSVEEATRVTQSWIDWIREDMREEEQDVLHCNLLRDDPIAVEMEDG